MKDKNFIVLFEDQSLSMVLLYSFEKSRVSLLSGNEAEEVIFENVHTLEHAVKLVKVEIGKSVQKFTICLK